MRNTYLAVGIIVVALVILVFAIVRTRLPQFKQSQTPSPTPMVEEVKNSVSLGQHTPARTTVIDSVTLTNAGFVVVFDAQDGQVLGVSERLEAGTHQNVLVNLSRKTVAGETLVAKLYVDNGDGTFDATSDQVVTDNETEVEATFQVVAQNGTSGFQIPATGLGEDSY